MRRAFFFTWLVVVGLLLLFGNDMGAFMVAAASLVFIAAAALALLAVPRGRFLPTLALPAVTGKGEPVPGELILGQPWWGAVFSVYCTLECENTLTGEVETLDFGGSRLKANTPFTLLSSHCGVLQVQVKTLLVRDPIGLFSRQVKCKARAHVLVQPKVGPVQLPPLSSAAPLESSQYSTAKAGMDVSETYAIREYQPGDPIRSIHWKLTEKLDKVMVREFGLPVGNSVLLALEMTPAVSPAGLDAAVELFFSAGLALVDEGFCVTLGWTGQDRAFMTCEAPTREGVAAAVGESLAVLDVSGAPDRGEYGRYESVLAVDAATCRLHLLH